LGLYSPRAIASIRSRIFSCGDMPITMGFIFSIIMTLRITFLQERLQRFRIRFRKRTFSPNPAFRLQNNPTKRKRKTGWLRISPLTLAQTACANEFAQGGKPILHRIKSENAVSVIHTSGYSHSDMD
jgi:hypothetical protein